MSLSPANSRLLALKRAIVTDLTAAKIVTECQPFSRLFEAESLDKVSFASPAAFVSVLAAPQTDATSDGDGRVRVEVAIAIAAKGKVGLTADEQSLMVAEAIFDRVAWQQWGMKDIWPVKARRMEMVPVPLGKGMALLGVRFDQVIRLGRRVVHPMDVDPSQQPDKNTVPQPNLIQEFGNG